MQSTKHVLQRFMSSNIFTTNHLNCLSVAHRTYFGYQDDNKEVGFLRHNKTVFPPQKPDEEKRPGYVCHARERIKYSPLRMWYIAGFIRGMTVDEAVKQLSFLNRKGAAIVKDILLEAQQMAVEEHNIEFKSNLWVAESFATKGIVFKGVRVHAKQRLGVVHYRYCNYYVRLEEGQPPKHYSVRVPQTGEEMLKQWMDNMHKRKVYGSL